MGEPTISRKKGFDCALHCRKLADETYALAAKAEVPALMGEYLAIAGKLVNCAERVDRGEPSLWILPKDD